MPWPFRSGLTVGASPGFGETDAPFLEITDEAALTASAREDFRVEQLVKAGDMVAQGAPVLQSRREPRIVLAAPMAGRVASVNLGPGRRLEQMVFFHEPASGRHEHRYKAAASGDVSALAVLLQSTGLWRSFRSRPFGFAPAQGEKPAAIIVMALDTKPGAPDPRLAIGDDQDDLERGIEALLRLTDGPVILVQDNGRDIVSGPHGRGRMRVHKTMPVHPWGLAGFHVHASCPAETGRPVWDIHAEDVAALGALLVSGLVPETRLVSVAGPAVTTPALVRCQPGADLRGLSHGRVRPGAHSIMSGSALDGSVSRWLGWRDRQVTVVEASSRANNVHWFSTALQRASRPLPIVPTAALTNAFGNALPAAAMARALSCGDDETAIRLGALSLLEEDLSLADYVTCAEPRLSVLLRGLLDKVQAEEAS